MFNSCHPEFNREKSKAFLPIFVSIKGNVMCVDQLVQKYIDALPSQYRSDVPIPSSNNVEYWPVQFWLWDKHIIEIDLG